VLVSDPALAGSDAVSTARALAAALTKLGFDLALFGSAAADSYGGVVPAMVAQFLDMPLLSFANTLEINGDTARIQTSAEIGYRVVEAPLPALVSVTKAINEPRYPSMRGIMQSKKKPIDIWSLSDLGLETGQVGASASGEQVVSAERVATARKGELYVGNEGAADRIVAFLVEQRVL
jgi:electron transfer flavoprotein beta subunit